MKSRTRTSRTRTKSESRKTRGTRRVIRRKTRQTSSNSRVSDSVRSAYVAGLESKIPKKRIFGRSLRSGYKIVKPRLTLKRGYTRWQVEHQSVGVGPLRKGKLEGWHSTEPKATRLKSIDKAVKKFGALSTYRSLNALAVLGKNRQPEVAEVAKEDRDYVRKRYFNH